ncbi:hypothetical protein OIU77_009962 [Salix suchowensis]|uniref:Uncharacterized protein n=1 Tax=Salix suchowensis TaxID=1278906 RepID=A0ABQ9A8Y1_9ROSI|nr:hypothetical protein OIU77_009962 [Salix suchowensis]
MDSIIFKLDYWHRPHRRLQHKKKAWESMWAICAMLNGPNNKDTLLGLIAASSKASTLDQLLSFLNPRLPFSPAPFKGARVEDLDPYSSRMLKMGYQLWW